MHPSSSDHFPRRDWLRFVIGAGAAAAILRALSVEGDLGILTAALYLEHEAIAAYQAGAESKLLSPAILNVAVAFQSDHKYHRDGIMGVLKSLGVEPAGPEKKYEFGRLRNEKDVLRLARDLENGAARAYATLASNIKTTAVLNLRRQCAG